MNSTICWYCEQEFTYNDPKYRDIDCPHCKVQNSIFNPEQPDWLPNEGEKEMAKPPKREKTNFEKVVVGELLPGIIENIEYDNEHKFKGFQGKEDTIQPAVRIVFKLDGYEFPHRSRWMKFSYAEKSNLYKKYILKLVENAQPDMDFDLDLIKGMKIKTLWEEQNEFQNIESIFPLEKKVSQLNATIEEESPVEEQ